MKIYKLCVMDGYKYIVDEKYNPELNELLLSDGEINEHIVYRCSISSENVKLALSDYSPAKIPIFTKRAYKYLFPYIKNDIYKPIMCVYGRDNTDIGEAYGIRAKQIDCLDYDKSKYKRIGEKLIIVSNYVFNHEIIGNSTIFRIPKCPFVFVTEDFVDLVKNSNLIGFDFSLKYDEDCIMTNTVTKSTKLINQYWNYNESPDIDTANELHSNLIIGYELLGISELCSCVEAVKRIDEFIDSLEKQEMDLSIPLGVVFGDAIIREYHWEWAVLGHDKPNQFTVVKSPENHYFINPINYLSRIITQKRENNLLLLFNMLASADKNIPSNVLEEIV